MLRKQLRAGFGIVALVAGACAGQVATAAPASASTTCSGAITWASSLAKEPRGQLVIYYNSAHGGTNSACMYHAGSTYNKRLYTEVTLDRCQKGKWDNWCFTDKSAKPNTGNFVSYAGPIGVTGTVKRCVIASGSIKITDDDWVDISSPAVGCP